MEFENRSPGVFTKANEEYINRRPEEIFPIKTFMIRFNEILKSMVFTPIKAQLIGEKMYEIRKLFNAFDLKEFDFDLIVEADSRDVLFTPMGTVNKLAFTGLMALYDKILEDEYEINI